MCACVTILVTCLVTFTYLWSLKTVLWIKCVLFFCTAFVGTYFPMINIERTALRREERGVVFNDAVR